MVYLVLFGLLFWIRMWSPLFWTWVFPIPSHLESELQMSRPFAPGGIQAFLWPGWSSGLNAQLPRFTKAAALRDCAVNEKRRRKHLHPVYRVLEMWISTGQTLHPEADWQSQGIWDSAYLPSLEESFLLYVAFLLLTTIKALNGSVLWPCLV